MISELKLCTCAQIAVARHFAPYWWRAGRVDPTGNRIPNIAPNCEKGLVFINAGNQQSLAFICVRQFITDNHSFIGRASKDHNAVSLCTFSGGRDYSLRQ